MSTTANTLKVYSESMLHTQKNYTTHTHTHKKKNYTTHTHTHTQKKKTTPHTHTHTHFVALASGLSTPDSDSFPSYNSLAFLFPFDSINYKWYQMVDMYTSLTHTDLHIHSHIFSTVGGSMLIQTHTFMHTPQHPVGTTCPAEAIEPSTHVPQGSDVPLNS